MTYQQEQIKPYSQEGAKGQQVEQMFDSIAPTYDLLNHTLSLGIDRRWRRAALRALQPHAPRRILDVATGTGDFALLFARHIAGCTVEGIDLSEGMLNVARCKIEKAGVADRVTFAKEDCLHLSYADEVFDAVTVAYGIRNFEDLDAGLREMCRVMRRGGTLVILELTTPQRFPMKQLFKVYSRGLMPAAGRLVAHDARAYSYLPATMAVFPQGEKMRDILKKAGFSAVTFRRFTFGLSTLYIATK